MSSEETAIIVGEPKEVSKESGINWENLRLYEYQDLVTNLKQDVENKVAPTLDQAKGLICYWLDYKANGDNKELPWPEAFKANPDGAYMKNFESTEISGSELRELLDESFNRLNEEDISTLSEYVLKNIKSLSLDLEDTNADTWSLQKLTLEKVSWNHESAKAVGAALVSLLAEYSESEGMEYKREWAFVEGMKFVGKEHKDMRKMIYRALASDKSIDTEMKAKVFGLTLENFEMADELNVMRQMMSEESLNQPEREDITEMLRQILNLPEGAEVYKSLEECYDAMSFEEYPVSTHTQPIREKFVEELVSKLDINKDERVLDVATGAGWLTKVLKENGGLRNVWGLDVNKSLLKTAKTKLGDYFAASTWSRLPFASETAALVTCLGRSLPHTENESEFEEALTEMARLVKKDGTLVFDMPDSSVGTYKKAVERNRETMIKMGCKKEIAEESFVIVDGPKGEKSHFYNRYAPSREKILETLATLNLKVEIIEEDIPDENGNPSGDKNIVFVCKKP